MTFSKLAFALASTFLLGSVAEPAMAASSQTVAFVTNTRPNVNFLDRSSRLAIDKSPSPRIRAFAHEEAEEQTIAANSLVAWSEVNTRSGEAVALGGGVAVITSPVGGVLNGAGAGVNQVLSPLGPVGAIASAPLTVAGGVTNGVGAALGDATGGVLPGTVVPVGQGAAIGTGLLPADRDNLDRLQMLAGRQFDALYLSSQEDSLRQLATLYRDYAASGDDEGLRTLAAGELRKVNHRLEEIGRL